MRQPGRNRRFQMRDTMLLSGWLFADLLLALFVIFLSANTVGVKPQPIPTPTPTALVTLSPTPTPLPRLELTYHSLRLPIDAAGLLNNSPGAQQALAREIRAQAFLQGRTVGLVVAYGNAPDASQIPTAQTIAQKVMNVMKTIGQGPQGFAFTRTSYYVPLFNLGGDLNFTEIDLYLFAR
ncbi:MAG TPA: hypothetical protein VFV38_14375 [Ktedonobacteraceae bacterium]|nr:hypothetical protein [Ktedonobacteraceae bacterium]